MKTKILLIFLYAILITSCQNTLELSPLDRVATGNFWKTETDFDNALAACYGNLQRANFSLGIYWDIIGGNGYSQYNENSCTQIQQGNITDVTGGLVSSIYNDGFASIARCNIFLEKLKEFDGMDTNIKLQREAEARMIRAYFYSFLYRCYGDVPIVDIPVNVDDMFQAKKPASEVLEFLMADLDYAIQNLQDVTYSQNKGRWTANAARGYKARMLLYNAYDASGNAIVSKMQEAQTLLNQITGYSLADEYLDNFQKRSQEACPEIIMSVKFSAPNNRTNYDHLIMDWMLVSPLSSLISLYDMADGTPGEPVPTVAGSRGVIDQALFNNESLDLREPRASKIFFIDSYRHPMGGVHTPISLRPLGTGFLKFMSPDIAPPFTASGAYNTDWGWIILRYADVLLMQAEVENELSNAPSEAVYKAINDIRKRGGTSPLPEGLTKEQMRERIRHERRIELCFEGSHYFDLKRWKIAKEVLNAVEDGLVVYRFEDKHYLWPLPQNEIVRSNGILLQNPDY